MLSSSELLSCLETNWLLFEFIVKMKGKDYVMYMWLQHLISTADGNTSLWHNTCAQPLHVHAACSRHKLRDGAPEGLARLPAQRLNHTCVCCVDVIVEDLLREQVAVLLLNTLRQRKYVTCSVLRKVGVLLAQRCKGRGLEIDDNRMQAALMQLGNSGHRYIQHTRESLQRDLADSADGGAVQVALVLPRLDELALVNRAGHLLKADKVVVLP